MSVSDRSDRVCVLGAGSSGLAAAKNLREHGLAVDVLEREDDLGGNWNYGKPGSRVYRSTHMISSKRCTQFRGFPMPAHYPDFPHHTQILAYLRAYAAHFRLEEWIEYRTPVERVEPFEGGRFWDVRPASGPTRRYAALVIANGHNWSPRWPQYPGRFTGQILHSASYKTPDVMAGKRVLVVGAGNSGCDLAVESAQNARQTFHSTRRGYHYIPKYLFGRPSDRLGDKLLRLRLPPVVRRALVATLLKWLVGSPEKAGLPRPDHKLFETHPIVNSLLLYYVRHGAVTPKPDIQRFEGQTVHFRDGTAEDIDLVVYATGYDVVFPFIDREHLNWQDSRPRLYQNVFHPHHDNLFVAGLIQPDSGQFGLVDWQMKAVALFLEGLRQGSAAAAKLRVRKQQLDRDHRPGTFLRTSRHYLEVEHWSYRRGLQKLVRDLTRRGAA